MEFVWVSRQRCSACGAGRPTADAVRDDHGFPVCAACSRREMRARQ